MDIYSLSTEDTTYLEITDLISRAIKNLEVAAALAHSNKSLSQTGIIINHLIDDINNLQFEELENYLKNSTQLDESK